LHGDPEGKAALFGQLADIDAFPLCLDVRDADELVTALLRPSRPGGVRQTPAPCQLAIASVLPARLGRRSPVSGSRPT